MATTTYINFIRSPSVPEVKKIILKADKHLQIKRVVGGSEVVTAYDFTNTPEIRSTSRPNYDDTVYRYMVDADGLHVWIACGVPANMALPVPDYKVQEYTAMATVWKATGEDNTIETETSGAQPDWIPGVLTTAEKKALAVEALKVWRRQVERWLFEAPKYATLVPDILTHLGYWLRSADYVLSELWREAILDWLTYESVVKEATKGPSSLDPDGDGAYNVEFFLRLKSAVASFPSGPNFGALWVNWWALSASSTVSDVSRVSNMVTDVLTHAEVAARTKSGMSETYNPTVAFWS